MDGVRVIPYVRVMSCRHRPFPLDRLLLKRVFQELAGIGSGMSGDILRGAGDHDLAAADPAFRAQCIKRKKVRICGLRYF